MFNKLKPAEAERLFLLSEELGEAQQAIGKILRHGYESYHPTSPEGPTNRQRLEEELGDVHAAISLLTLAEDLDSVNIENASHEKLDRVGKYMHHQKKAKPKKQEVEECTHPKMRGSTCPDCVFD